jgi:hypothetical protein
MLATGAYLMLVSRTTHLKIALHYVMLVAILLTLGACIIQLPSCNSISLVNRKTGVRTDLQIPQEDLMPESENDRGEVGSIGIWIPYEDYAPSVVARLPEWKHQHFIIDVGPGPTSPDTMDSLLKRFAVENAKRSDMYPVPDFQTMTTQDHSGSILQVFYFSKEPAEGFEDIECSAEAPVAPVVACDLKGHIGRVLTYSAMIPYKQLENFREYKNKVEERLRAYIVERKRSAACN